MYDRRQKIIEKIQILPKGSVSASRRYWCVTCKKLFRLEEPVCPYMTSMCVNSPIAVEKFAPESTEWLEKMGLFYPKIPQMVMAALLKENPAPIGKRLAETGGLYGYHSRDGLQWERYPERLLHKPSCSPACAAFSIIGMQRSIARTKLRWFMWHTPIMRNTNDNAISLRKPCVAVQCFVWSQPQCQIMLQPLQSSCAVPAGLCD